MGFLKPIDTDTLPNTATWQDRAGNHYFALQSRKASNVFGSLFSALGTVSTLGPNKKPIVDFEFRIVLKCRNKKVYIVSVDETFDKIHTDWNYVESNLFLKLAELDSKRDDQIDALLLKQFAEMTEEYLDPKAAELHQKIAEMTEFMIQAFPNLEEEKLLNFYACAYIINDATSIRGRLFITRNYFCFHGQPSDSNIPTCICLPFKDFMSVDLTNARRLLQPDNLQVGVKDKAYTFSLHFHRKEIYRALCCLCDAAMNRLVKGAELSVTASSDMYSKGNPTGDLASSIGGNAGGANMLMGRSRGDLFSPIGGTSRLSDCIEDDFSDEIRESVTSPATTDSESIPIKNRVELLYSQITTLNLNTLEDLDTQLRSTEFQNVFRLPGNECISIEESPCYLYQKHDSSTTTGSLYLAQEFMCFAATATPNNAAIQNLPLMANLNSMLGVTVPLLTSVNLSSNSSLLFDAASEVIFSFVIPYPYITSVSKQPPTALSTGLKIAISISGYLVITIKNKFDYWLSFSSVKARDKISSEILQRIKSTGWQFDNDSIIGTRNGDFSSPVTIPQSRGKKVESLNGSLDQYSADTKKKVEINKVGLRLLCLDNGVIRNVQAPSSIQLWEDYLDSNGRDACMVKDYKRLRKLIMKTQGIPDMLRGDFWMMFTGAWHSRPLDEYYENMVKEKQGKVGPFTEEIEKDVHRSLPEHSAYQSELGLSALRRVLTSYSFRNPTIGYAQALNIISAVLLLFLREDDAFWLLSHIVERVLPDHYTKTLVGSVVDQSVFGFLVQTHLPTLWAHMDKINLDLSTVSVPWFVVLFLNTIALNTSVKLLDCFFLDGPKFLFWFALSVLKVNEKKLLQKGRDDDLYMQIIKDYFSRLGDRSSDFTQPETPQDLYVMKGQLLFEHTLTLAYGVYAGMVTTDTIEMLRSKYRLQVVHQMDSSNRRSQTRTLEEQVLLSVEEVGIVYDQIQILDFAKEERRQHLTEFNKFVEQEQFEEDEIRNTLVGKGGWGMVKANQKSTAKNADDRSAIGLRDFRKVFAKVSPWKSALLRSKGNAKKSPLPCLDDEGHVPLIDRIYVYSSVHFKVARSRRRVDETHLNNDAYIVDLATTINVLDIILKQPLNSRMRFLFDIHDLDGDGYLNQVELKSVMDSLLEMFEQARHQDGKNSAKVSTGPDEELYLKAISSFLSSSLKLGSNKGMQSMESGLSHKKAVAHASRQSIDPSGEDDDDITSIGKMKVEATQGKRVSLFQAEQVNEGVRLSFNEFLLAVLSQSVFVQYFERVWRITLNEAGSCSLDSI